MFSLEALGKKLREKDTQILLWDDRFGPCERLINLSFNKDTTFQEVKRNGRAW